MGESDFSLEDGVEGFSVVLFFGEVDAGPAGTRSIPQIGHEAGLGERMDGCIGQVQIWPSDSFSESAWSGWPLQLVRVGMIKVVSRIVKIEAQIFVWRLV